MTRSCIYRGEVLHHRLQPRQHRFTYKVTAWLLDLEELPRLHKTLRGFSWNRFNLIAFNESDYGDGSGFQLTEYLNKILQKEGFEKPHRISLLCYPRYLGYVFNPLSTYFCYDQQDNVFAIVYEVSNTFGERHSYILAANKQIDADQGIETNQTRFTINQAIEKTFYVSPFNPESGQYQFQIVPPDEHVSIAITQSDDQGNLMQANFNGKQVQLRAFTPVYEFMKAPLMTLKVIVAIHWEAARLWLKGLRPYTRPKTTKQLITSKKKEASI